jgi:hypothetical protein
MFIPSGKVADKSGTATATVTTATATTTTSLVRWCNVTEVILMKRIMYNIFTSVFHPAHSPLLCVGAFQVLGMPAKGRFIKKGMHQQPLPTATRT